jgi:predicted dehydrogenase
MANTGLRVGLIGCGGIAPVHLDSYCQDGRVSVAAVADVEERRAEALAARCGAAAYTDYRQMIDEQRLYAVSVLTPPAFHREASEVALAAGVHVLAEKPLATTAADAQALAEAAQRSGRLLLVAQCHRFHEPVRRARALIESGDLGAIATYRNRFSYSSGTPDERSRGRGGILLDNGAHSSYLFRYLVGPVKSVFGWAPAAQRGQIEDLCVCTLLLEATSGHERSGGGVVELDGAARPGEDVIAVFGEKGCVFIDYAGPSRFVRASGAAVALDDPGLPGNHRFDREIAHFVNCILGEEAPEIPAEEGVADLRVLEAAFQSIRSGRAVTV